MKITIALLFIFNLTLGIAAQTDRYPNELRSYLFFDKGKLQNLDILDSSKEDIKKIFGSECRKICDYNDKWTVVFEYYDDLWTTTRTENGHKVNYILDAKYLNKVRAIELRPKKPLKLVNFEFPGNFQHTTNISTVEFHGGGGAESIREVFHDGFGLSYEVALNEKYESDPINGALTSIRYEFPEIAQKILFVLSK